MTALAAAFTKSEAEINQRLLNRNGAAQQPVRTRRLRVPSDFFKQQAVHFTKARVDLNGAISADGHDLDLYGAALMRRNEICTSRTGGRWACGQRAFMALRGLADGKAITCTFKHESEPPKAVCLVGDSNVAEALLGKGWAKLSDGVTDILYVDAEAAARARKAGVWGDGPP
jgi:endonuclease YncB( thermonuclease family)